MLVMGDGAVYPLPNFIGFLLFTLALRKKCNN